MTKSERESEIERVVLTPEEEKNAILEGRRKKWFKERTKEYWDKQESIKPKR